MFRFPGKIPISIHPLFWFLAFLIGWLNTSNVLLTLIWAGIILVSILIHEFGHAITAVAFGQNAQIELMALGGLTHRRGGIKLKLWQEFLIVLNGPLAGFALAGISWWIYKTLYAIHPQSLLTYAVQITFYVNFFWTILNLIPVQPLDGGKLFSIILESIFGLKGTKIALFISLLLAAVFGLFFFVMREYFIGSLFMLFTYESYRSWRESLSITEQDQDFDLQNLLKEAEAELRLGNNDSALSIYQNVREQTKKGVIYQAATENAAHLLVEKGDLKQAYDIMSTLGKKLTQDGLNLMHQLAYSQKKWEEAADLGDKAYKIRPTYRVALMNAASHSAMGNIKPAIGWLQSAIHDGLPNPKQVLDKSEFDGIRNDPMFRQLLER